jgi:hypothetical protein
MRKLPAWKRPTRAQLRELASCLIAEGYDSVDIVEDIEAAEIRVYTTTTGRLMVVEWNSVGACDTFRWTSDGNLHRVL